VRDELLKDFRSGAARPFFALMLDSGLFYDIFPTWAGQLGPGGETRLQELVGRLDLLVREGFTLTDSLVWAVFLTAFLEPALQPRDFKELREVIQEKIKAALGGIEFPRQRQDEVSQMLALEQRLAPLAAKGQPIPARLTRLAMYPGAWLLHQIKGAPEAELLAHCHPDSLPAPAAAAPKRRRTRRRRPRGGRGRRRGEGA